MTDELLVRAVKQGRRSAVVRLNENTMLQYVEELESRLIKAKSKLDIALVVAENKAAVIQMVLALSQIKQKFSLEFFYEDEGDVMRVREAGKSQERKDAAN